MAKLDLICSTGAVHSHGEFHLKKLVRLRPRHLKLNVAHVLGFGEICPLVDVELSCFLHIYDMS